MPKKVQKGMSKTKQPKMSSDVNSRKLVFLLFKRLFISDITSTKALCFFMEVANRRAKKIRRHFFFEIVRSRSLFKKMDDKNPSGVYSNEPFGHGTVASREIETTVFDPASQFLSNISRLA